MTDYIATVRIRSNASVKVTKRMRTLQRMGGILFIVLGSQLGPSFVPRLVSAQPAYADPRLQAAVAWAQAQLADPSVKFNWGSGTKTFCERFVENAYGTERNYNTASNPTDNGAWQDLQDRGLELDALQPALIQPGDLVYFQANDGNSFAGHAGIYIGDNQMIAVGSDGVTSSSITDWGRNVAPLLGYAAPPEDWPGVTLPAATTSPATTAPAPFTRAAANRAEALLIASPVIVLVPAAGQAPFNQAGLSASQIGADANGVSYGLTYGTAATASLRGEPGRLPTQGGPPACATAYCSYPGLDGKTPAAEVFGGVRIKGEVAAVFHAACCAGDVWEVYWYDPAANMHYTLTVDADFDPQVGQSGVNRDNVSRANHLVDVANQLTRLATDTSAPQTGSEERSAILASWSHPVLLPPPGLQPFTGLGIESVSASIALSQAPLTGRESYSVNYRGSAGVANVSGEVGEQPYAMEQRGGPGCQAVASYCVWRITSGATVERFSNLDVNGQPAAVMHAIDKNSDWSAAWYDSSSDTSYSIGFYDALDPQLRGAGIGQSNLPAAQQILDIAAQLVPFPVT